MEVNQILNKIHKAGPDEQYHTVLLDKRYVGRRDSANRHVFPYCFVGKRVLDIGCNIGSMLFHIGSRPKKSLGLDKPEKCEAADAIRQYHGYDNIEFQDIDLAKDPKIYDIIGQKWDIVFYLAMCIHLSNNREVLECICKNTNTLLFEINTFGDPVEYVQQQLGIVSPYYNYVHFIQEVKGRHLYFCTNITPMTVYGITYNVYHYHSSWNTDVWVSTDNKIIKKKTTQPDKDLFWLQKNMSVTPTVLQHGSSWNDYTIEDWAGNHLTNWSKPSNWKTQYENIYKTLSQHNCDAYDIEPLVLNNKISIVDFGGCNEGQPNKQLLYNTIDNPDRLKI